MLWLIHLSIQSLANSPTWENNIEGQINLRDAVNKSISFQSEDGKRYALNPVIATLMVRPRGWHLVEHHMTVYGEPVSGSMFDFGLYFFHNAKTALNQGSGPYFYLPKVLQYKYKLLILIMIVVLQMESHLEARLWKDIFEFSERQVGVPRGSIRYLLLIA